MHDFAADAAQIARERHARGEITRRELLVALAGLGLAGHALAQPSEFVVANYGGDAATAMDTAFNQPFAKQAGIKVVTDGAGPTAGRIRAMVESGRVTWDVCDSGPGSCLELGNAGLLEEMDWSVVKRDAVTDPKFAFPWGIANYTFSFVLAYDRSRFAADPPKSWADFWDVKKYPGKRTMWTRNILGICESALMADGVKPADLYPMDVDRAMRKLAEIRPHLIGWQTGAMSQDLLRTGEVVIGNVWNTRVSHLIRESGTRFAFTWNQGILAPGVWVVPKGNQAGKAMAMRYIAATQNPEWQIEFLRLNGSGPANPAAAPLVPEPLRAIDPSSHAAEQAIFDGEWYGQHQTKTLERWLDLVG